MTRELRIGLFVGGTLLILAAFIFVVGDLSVLFKKKGYDISVGFDTAAGLDKRAVVKMAGVKIGYVRDIELDGRRARVNLAIDGGTEIPRDSRATFGSLGLLGEKYVEILPGQGTEICRPGDILTGLKSAGFDQVGEILVSLGDEVKNAGEAIKETLGPETRANLSRTLENLASVSSGLRDLLGRNQDDVRKVVRTAGSAVDNLDKSVATVSAAAQDALHLIKDIAAENRDALKSNVDKIKELLGKIEESLRLLNSALEKVARGEGTVGKLLQDPELYSDAKKTLEAVRTATRGISSLKPTLDIQAGYYGRSALVRPALAAGVWVASNVALEGGIVRDPWKSTTEFSLQGQYRVGGLVARAGFIESEFGVGMDYYTLRDRLVLGLEGFDFNRPTKPRLRMYSKFFPSKYLYFIAGVDELALAAKREFYFGLGVGLR
jgi:phospholipid/cholesterol/gamma-HCH transport system substrate-binding protein